MKKLYLLVFFFAFNCFGQEDPLIEYVLSVAENYPENEIFHLLRIDSEYEDKKIDDEVVVKTYLTYQSEEALDIIDQNEEFISLSIPINDSVSVVVDLVNFSHTLNDLTVTLSSGNPLNLANYKYGLYRGMIRGDEKSLAAISLFADEIVGFISNEDGNYIIGKIKDIDKHMIYNDKDVLAVPDFTCDSPEEGSTEDPVEDSVEDTQKCVRLFYETDYNMFLAHNSNYNSVLNYINSLYNGVATLYNTIPVSTLLHKILIWDTHDPYTYSPGEPLTPINYTYYYSRSDLMGADFSQFVRQGPSTGQQAGSAATSGDNFTDICYPSPTTHNSQIPRPSTIYSYPAYSWPVSASAHEFGHLMGSRHTHACVWNGNNTAIDGCGPAAGYNEGSCPAASIPSSGTIMSYCHLLSVGVNFANGFGTQPGQRILTKINNSLCLQNCTACTGSFHVKTDVLANVIDKKQASDRLTVSNRVITTATGIYHAGNTVVLSDGFHSASGSKFRGYVEGCTNTFVGRNAAYGTKPYSYKPEEINNSSIKLFPNPSNTKVFITTGNLVLNKITVTASDGKTVYNKMTNEASFELDVSTFSNGIYIVNIQTSDGAVFAKKLIKN